MFHCTGPVPSLKRAVARLEDGIIMLSGPALAISAMIAGVDLVIGGNVLQSVIRLVATWRLREQRGVE